MNKQWRGQGSCADSYHERLQTLIITGGNHVQDNRHHITHHHDHSQTFNTQKEKTVFNDPVYGYIREVKNAKGPISAYRHETNVLRQDKGLDPVPRSLLRASKHSTPSHIPAIDHDKRPHHNPPQSTHRTMTNCVSPSSHTRGVAGGRREEPLGRLTLTGGTKHSSPASCGGLPTIDVEVEAELSQLSPEMQEFVATLQYKATRVTVKKGRKERRSRKPAPRTAPSAQRQRVDSPQRPDDSQSSFNHGTFTEDQDDGDDR